MNIFDFRECPYPLFNWLAPKLKVFRLKKLQRTVVANVLDPACLEFVNGLRPLAKEHGGPASGNYTNILKQYHILIGRVV